MLQTIKRELKDLIGLAKPDEVFRRLKEETLDSNSDLYNDLVIIQARYNEGKRAGSLGLIAFQEKGREFNNVNDALLYLIDRITISDLNQALRLEAEKHVFIPKYHTYACDRFEQRGIVELQFIEEPARKIRHFYLHGDARQAMSSLFECIGRDMGGQLNNRHDKDYQPSKKLEIIRVKPEKHPLPKLFLHKILKEVLAQFKIESEQNIFETSLSDVLSAPFWKAENFSSKDLVFVMLTMDHHNWNSSVTPKVVKQFIENFCQCELPDDAPNFFFFYGVEYQKDNIEVKKSVEEAIAAAEYGDKLDVLTPVPISDLGEWFSRYKELLPKGVNYDDYATSLFPDKENIDMIDIELKLLELTERHNKGLLPDF